VDNVGWIKKKKKEDKFSKKQTWYIGGSEGSVPEI